MAFIDHFAPDAGLEGNGFTRLSAHDVPGGIFLWASGDITKAQLIAAFSFTEEPDADADETQINEMQVAYTAKATDADKIIYVNKIHHTLMLYRNGKLTEAKAKSILEIT